MNTLPVIFKKHLHYKGWHITAFFPTELDALNPAEMVCYSHIGQHGRAHINYFHKGKKCKQEDYQPLLNELKCIYEKGGDAVKLKVYQKKTAAMDAARIKEYNRLIKL